MVTERKKRQPLRKDRNDSSVSKGQPCKTTICASCSSSASASAERSDNAEAPPNVNDVTERRAKAPGLRGCCRRRMLPRGHGGSAGAAGSTRGGPRANGFRPPGPPKWRDERSAWSSCSTTSASSSCRSPRLHHLGKSPSERPSQLRNASAAKAVRPARMASNSESNRPPPLPGHHNVRAFSRGKEGGVRAATNGLCGRAEESRRRTESCLHCRPTARSAASNGASLSRPEGGKLKANNCRPGHAAATASKAETSMTSRRPSNARCSKQLPYAAARRRRVAGEACGGCCGGVACSRAIAGSKGDNGSS
mmetsp:Transcript_140776/g.392398  ORF Transcript_140776/g.392398 Transcript_140776/m.392398 type:complete len:308 (-) Transcript_140776:224-1147(-)